MRFAWITAIKDWRRHRRDPLGLLMWIGIPLLVGSLLIMMSGGKGGPDPKAHLLVADEDDSFLSGLLIGALGQEAMGGLIQGEQVELADGRARMDRGEATAILIIPSGFGQAVLEETPTTLQLFTNPSQSILPGIVEEVLSILVDGTFYLHRLIGEELKLIANGPPTGVGTLADPQVAAISVKINHIVTKLSEYVFPPVIQLATVEDEASEDAGPTLNIALLFLPSILFMSLLFMAQGVSMDLWAERDKKTLRRVVATPQHVLMFLAGKILAGVGIMLIVTAIAISAGYLYFGLHVDTLPFALLWTLFSGAFLIVMMLVLQVYSPSERAAGVLSMAVIFPLMMIGGNFFPFEAMPSGMAFIGRMTPNGWALEQLKRILNDDVEWRTLAVSFGGLLVIGSVLFYLVARRMRTTFVQG